CTTLSDNVTKYCSVQAALVALSTIGSDAHGNPNVGVTRSAIDGSYTITFIGDLAGLTEPLFQTNVLVAVNTGNGASQTVTLATGTGQTLTGTFSLDYTYYVRPLGLSLDPNAVGLLTEQTYYYEVAAIM